MPTFSKTSRLRLSQCHPDLQRVFNEVINRADCTILCGQRGEFDQDKAFAEGRSKVKYPNSKHNSTPSMAVDVGPWPLYWYDIKSFEALAIIVKQVATELGVDIVWGGDWTTFKDYPHWELKQ